MLALKDFNYHHDIDFEKSSVKIIIPDANDRAPNDPLYFLSSELTLKLAQSVARVGKLSPVNYHNEVTLAHLVLIRDLAISRGWDAVYYSGRQLVFEAKFKGLSEPDPKGVIRLSNHTGTITVCLEGFPDERSLSVIRCIEPAGILGNPRAMITAVGGTYVGRYNSLFDRPVKMKPMIEGNPRNLQYTVVEDNIDFVLDTETGILRWLSNDSSVPMGTHVFQIDFVVAEPVSDGYIS